MAFVLKDRVRETTTTTGTGTITLGGSVTGYQSFNSAIGDGNTTYYTIANAYQWEVGLGTYSASGNTLARTTVLASSTGGTTLVPFAQGTKDIFVSYPAEAAVFSNPSGNVGIGTTPGGYKLDIGSTSTNGNILRGTYGTSSLVALQDSNGAGYAGMYSSNDFVLITSNTEQLRIKSGGNVGIGTNNPTSKLTVFGNFNTTGTGTFGSSGTGLDGVIAQSTNGVDTRLTAQGSGSLGSVGTYSNNPFLFTINNVERMRISTTGYVGIGMIPSGSYLLEVNGSIGANNLDILGIGTFGSNGTGLDGIIVKSTNSVDTRLTAQGSGLLGSVGTYSNNPFLITINNTERMRISTAGNVGIGMIPSGSYLLEVNGSIGANNLTVSGATIFNGTATFNNDTVFKDTVWQLCDETAIIASTPQSLYGADIYYGIITTSGTFTLTMTTGTALDTFFNPPSTNVAITFTIINTSGTLTFNTAVAGITLVGSASIPAGTSASFKLRRISANTYGLYRI